MVDPLVSASTDSERCAAGDPGLAIGSRTEGSARWDVQQMLILAVDGVRSKISASDFRRLSGADFEASGTTPAHYRQL